MRINNPKLFNGDLLATKKQVATWLKGVSTEDFTGLLSTAVIPIVGISGEYNETLSANVFPIYADKITMGANNAQTISAAIDELSSAIDGVKAYAVSGSNAISVSTDGGTDKETFTVGLTLNGSSLNNSSNGLKVTDGYVEGIVSGTTAADLATGIKVVKSGTATTGYAASYEVQFNGVTLGQKIDIPKDKFVKSAEFISSLTAEQVTEAGTGFDVGDAAIKFTIYISDGTTTEPTESVFYVNVSRLVNDYDAANGVTLSGNTFIGVVDTANSDPYLTVGSTGFKLTGVSARFDGIDDDVEYISSFVSGLPADISYVSSFVSGLPTDISNVESDVEYISSFVSGLPTDISNVESDVEYISSFVSGLPTEISYVSSFVSGLPADISYVSSFVSGLPTDIEYVSGVVSGHTEDIEYISGVVTGIVEQVQSTNKFVSATVIDTSSPGVEDTLYYTLDGQTAIYDNSGWRTISMEAVTTLTGTVNDTTTATSKAIKEYVDAVESELPKKAEIFTVDKPFGSSTSAVVTGRVIAVYAKTTTAHSNAGDQVYPEINYASGISTISASDLSATETFTIVYVTATEQQGQ